MSLEQFLETLAAPAVPPPAAEFVELSDLSPEELGQFARAWYILEVERQRAIISTMVELAEDNAELDFCAIFKMCLKDRDEQVLQKGIEGLWEHEDRSIIRSLTQILHSDKSKHI